MPPPPAISAIHSIAMLRFELLFIFKSCSKIKIENLSIFEKHLTQGHIRNIKALGSVGRQYWPMLKELHVLRGFFVPPMGLIL